MIFIMHYSLTNAFQTKIFKFLGILRECKCIYLQICMKSVEYTVRSPSDTVNLIWVRPKGLIMIRIKW